ncbi:MAG TPA: RDD family protein [Gaiellaceae bacterium]|nr:RDD family protein [Gaiellaceae bacterium]
MEQHAESLPAAASVPARAEEPIVYAAWGQRFGAVFLDGIITALLALMSVAVVVAITGGYAAVFEGLETDTQADDDAFYFAYFGWLGAWALVGGVYHTVLHGRGRGQTGGKMMLGIRVRDESTNEPIGFGRAFARWIMPGLFWTFFWIPGILDAVWPLWDPKKQTFHDKIARSLVVRA